MVDCVFILCVHSYLQNPTISKIDLSIPCDYIYPYGTNNESDNWRLQECDSFPDLLLLLFLKELDLTVLAKIENILETSGVRSLI